MFERAEKQGHAEELYQLYLEGRGVQKDQPRAIALLKKAADGGSFDARWVLGFRHLSGDAVPRDEKAALILFRAAAAQCHAPSQWAVGRIVSERATTDEELIDA